MFKVKNIVVIVTIIGLVFNVYVLNFNAHYFKGYGTYKDFYTLKQIQYAENISYLGEGEINSVIQKKSDSLIGQRYLNYNTSGFEKTNSSVFNTFKIEKLTPNFVYDMNIEFMMKSNSQNLNLLVSSNKPDVISEDNRYATSVKLNEEIENDNLKVNLTDELKHYSLDLNGKTNEYGELWFIFEINNPSGELINFDLTKLNLKVRKSGLNTEQIELNRSENND